MLNLFQWNPDADVVCLHPRTIPWKAGLCLCMICDMCFRDDRFLLGAVVGEEDAY